MQPIYKAVITFLFSLMLVVSLTSAFAQDHWTHFRGSNLDGISADSLVPVTWNDTTNIVWKTDIRGRG